ncbi:MAG: hypothetical protein LAQ69_40795 [Acidobacteriia bacterium]|nr:hypothetical protein [Terriglobia bacterium]
MNASWVAGAYSVAISPAHMCMNSGSSNQGFVYLFGTWQGGGLCSNTLSAASASVGPAASTGTVSVIAGPGCSWTAASNVTWIVITAGASGTGSGTVGYAVSANSATSQRTGTLTIAGSTYTVTQAAAPACPYTLNPSSASAPAEGISGSVAVTTGSGCPWAAVSGVTWITVNSGGGPGNGTVKYTVAANTDPASRNGTITIAGVSFPVNQAGATGQHNPPTITAIVNTADYTPNIAPGSLISIQGTNLAGGPAQAPAGPLPATLGGTTVEWTSGTAWAPLPLFSVAAGLINAQFPFGLEGSTIQVRVRNGGGISAATSTVVQTVAPRLLTKTMDGKGEAVVMDSLDWKLVSAAMPARGDAKLTLYLTGLGAVSGDAAAGKPGGDDGANGPWNPATAKVSVSIGGTAAEVLWAGLTPGAVGLYQVDLQVAADTPAGIQPIIVTANETPSPDNVNASVADAATTLAEGTSRPRMAVSSRPMA